MRTLENKIYKCMTSIWKDVYIDKLENIVERSSNKYHRGIKRKPVDIK